MNRYESRRTNNFDAEIGFRIRQLRQNIGLSQTEMAKLVGISFQQFQKYEQGKNRISASRLVTIAQALGVTPHEILKWPDDHGTGVSYPAAADPADPFALAHGIGSGSSPANDAYLAAVDSGAIADLWQAIPHDSYRRALVFLMQSIIKESSQAKGDDGRA